MNHHSSKETLSLWLCGVGRMAQSIASIAPQKNCHIAGAVVRSNAKFSSTTQRDLPFATHESWQNIMHHNTHSGAENPKIHAVIDFSSPEGFLGALAFSCQHQIPFISGTTGLNDEHEKALHKAAQEIPIFYARNTSIAVALLRHMTSKTAAILFDADIEILETHHRHKKDAPSGTALALLESAANARGFVPKDAMRQGHKTGKERQKGSIGVSAMRGGSVVGDHDVSFFLENEVVRLSHSARSRDVFASGALDVARFVYQKPPGLYGMDDYLSEMIPDAASEKKS